ncbi:phosphatidylinositol-specific phospholipase C [Flavobacterium fluviatile]|uniref:phosphatidylinositol-specific phospholipase C n=1 Tax=Flavobacterium fluviatile TaxID=1862387 RepID=UPI0013D5CD50|nr:phosphatidylinositol-specific phospholipase C [Flavobacterium fluviatile]
MKNYLQNFGCMIGMIGILFISCETPSIEEVADSNSTTTTETVPKNLEITKKSAAYTMSNWMGALDENLALTALTIPGTHDSGARFETFSGTAICQKLSIDDQLKAGVRYLDIRGRHYNNTFEIHHGVVYQNINFTAVLNSCKAFLAQHPSETIIMSLKEEHTASGNNRSYEATFDSYVQQNTALWYLGNTMPTIKVARGKIVLVRRFAATTSKGIDATNWADNAIFEINGAQKIKIQDQYKVPNNNTKWSAIATLFNEAKTGAISKLYLNYCSGYKPGLFSIPNIPTVADFVNPKVSNYFTTASKGRYGIIIMDFTTETSNTLIVKSNF